MAVSSFNAKAAPAGRPRRGRRDPTSPSTSRPTSTSPRRATSEVEIRSYERKRDLLSGKIGVRRQALTLQTYRYKGARGRRDPLVDPRVPARVDDPNAWTVQRQQEEVDELVARVEEAQGYWVASNAANSVLERMVQRSEAEKMIFSSATSAGSRTRSTSPTSPPRSA